MNNTMQFPLEFNLHEYKKQGHNRRSSISKVPLDILDTQIKEKAEQVTELKMPIPKTKMKGFKHKQDTDQLITTDRKKQRKLPVEKKQNITSSFIERMEQENDEQNQEGGGTTDPNESEIQSRSTKTRKKELIQSKMPDYIRNKEKIIKEIKEATLNEGDFKYLKEGFFSDQDYKILFSFIALQQILDKDTKILMNNKYETQILMDIIFQLLINRDEEKKEDEELETLNYQEVGFYCYIKLSFIVYLIALKDQNVDPDIFIIHLRERIIHIMEQLDQKLCESYYDQISSFMLEDIDFPKFMAKLNLWELVIKHYGLFMSSLHLQKKLAMIIIECGFKHIKHQKIKNVEELLRVVISIFIFTEEKETQSYCLWSLSLYSNSCQNQKDLQILIDKLNEKKPQSLVKIISCLNPEDDCGEFLEPSCKIIQKLIDEDGQEAQTFIDFFLANDLLDKISLLFKTNNLNKIQIALNILNSLISENTLEKVLENKGLFKEINDLFKKEINNNVDMFLNLEFLKIYKILIELSEDLLIIGELQIIESLCNKLNQIFSNSECDPLYQEITEVILYIFEEFDKEDLVQIFVQDKNYLALEKLQYVESHKMYKNIYWMLKRFFPQYEGDLFNISENDSIFL